MSFSEDFKQSIFDINEETFLDSSLQAFNFQYKNCNVYNLYCNHLNVDPNKVNQLHKIPFLPIEFFKNHAVKSGEWDSEKIFKSSGTTATGRSQHHIKELNHYHKSAKEAFEKKVGYLNSYKIIAILPSYQEQGDSSLISMIDYFIEHAKEGSGYYLQSEESLMDTLNDNQQKLVIGVSYALLDLAETGVKLNNALVMETGGMKGRRKEMTRSELHRHLSQEFGVEDIWSEYGMTELQSQAYGKNGSFKLPPWSKCMIRDINDPFSYFTENRTGGINVIDLANIDTCCFIETKDLGRVNDDYFEVLGRFDNSDIRGCNLMI